MNSGTYLDLYSDIPPCVLFSEITHVSPTVEDTSTRATCAGVPTWMLKDDQGPSLPSLQDVKIQHWLIQRYSIDAAIERTAIAQNKQSSHANSSASEKATATYHCWLGGTEIATAVERGIRSHLPFKSLKTSKACDTVRPANRILHSSRDRTLSTAHLQLRQEAETIVSPLLPSS